MGADVEGKAVARNERREERGVVPPESELLAVEELRRCLPEDTSHAVRQHRRAAYGCGEIVAKAAQAASGPARTMDGWQRRRQRQPSSLHAPSAATRLDAGS